MNSFMRHFFWIILASLLLSACGHSRPDQVYDACLILEDNRSWWRALKRSEDRWGISPGTQLAFLKRESSFNRHARPARRQLLGFIPGPRPSSAYGYAQAVDSTWDWYRRETGRRGADRDDFSDAVDFIGWYASKSWELSRIPPDNARALYLAYHEGHGGYNRRTHAGKRWLLSRADDVQNDARRYDSQIEQCRRRLDRGWLPFT